MAEKFGDILATPDTCDDIEEYDNTILDAVDVEPAESEEDSDTEKNWREIEEKFARYERNYRIRRIRELTKAPLLTNNKGRGRRKKVVA
ncbi:MAG: hypothetical protein QHI38_13750 [Armatimonadota bacterium]|nr:hypothetical protein [Armatimonadota bacterium]